VVFILLYYVCEYKFKSKNNQKKIARLVALFAAVRETLPEFDLETIAAKLGQAVE